MPSGDVACAFCVRPGGGLVGVIKRNWRICGHGTYSQFTNCMQTFAACNNIFYIKDGVVTQYSPIGTGGMRCYTNEQLRPGFVGAADIR